MIDHNLVKKAFRVKLNAKLDALTFSATARAWENVGFTPPDPPAVHTRERYFPGDQSLQGWDLMGMVGIYMIEIAIPKGESTEGGELLAKNLLEEFLPGESFSNGAMEIVVDRSERLTGGLDPEGMWYILPVQFTFRTYDSK